MPKSRARNRMSPSRSKNIGFAGEKIVKESTRITVVISFTRSSFRGRGYTIGL